MDLTIPVYIETAAATVPSKPPEYVVRPLFFDAPVMTSPILQAALNKLTQKVREMLVELGKVQRHGALAAWTFNPETETRRCEIRIEVAKQSARLKLLLIMMKRFDRTVAFTPSFPDVWFEVLPEQNPEERLAEAITESLKKQVKDGNSGDVEQLDRYSLKGSAWVSDIEFRINPPRVREKKKDVLFAFLGSVEQMDGESELYRVGRCLNHQYPHDLNRVHLRDLEVAELVRLLSASDRRPVLLLGNRQAGKTAILHEYVFRHVAQVGNPHRDKEAVWLLSPQRLISGMSYVGQWESRFHAIIKHAAQRELTLYFDDLLGLFQAGVTSQSTLNVAALLRTVLEQRKVRVVAEMTPEELRVLREKDRSFADQFHIIRVDELTGDDNLKVLFGLQRQLELRYGVRFSIDALPAVVDRQRRYARDVAFPGKAAVFMKRLAVKAAGDPTADSETRTGRAVVVTDRHGSSHAPGQISRERVLDAFHQQSGLPRSFLDQRTTLTSNEIEERLRDRFVGQPDAVRAAVDIISIARARLNDPTRPVASMLLLGPTGVGKTEFAKSLANYLFGNSDRLLRFDMNEYVSPNAVPQLVGTFAQPEGLLTAAVRRQPFAVLLFDEIEKGHPDVFDLLLQVLGEGRLTDARGRTTDFSNTIIVLTSNLGTQRTESGLGFGGVSSQGASTAIRAAENFFRPEFFNRLDRVIPFDRLSRGDMTIIARHLMSDVLHRDGLVRRQCVLNATPRAIEWVIDQGYNPVLGARALKRAIEKELTRPIAAFLAEQGGPSVSASGERQGVSPPSVVPLSAGLSEAQQDSSAGQNSAAKEDALDARRADAQPLAGAAGQMNPIMLIDIDRAEKKLSVSIRSLAACPLFVLAKTESDHDVESVLARCEQMLRTLDEQLPNLKPAGTFQSGRLSPAQSRYLLVQDETRRLKQWHEEIRLALAARQHAASGAVVSRPGRTAKGLVIRRKGPSHGNQVGRDAADDEIDDFVETRFAGPPRDVNLHDEPMDLIARCHWVCKVAKAELSRMDEYVQLRMSCLDLAGLRFMEPYIERLRETWSDELGLETELHDDFDDARTRGLSIRGMLARDYAALECGYHLTEPEFSVTPSLFCVHEALAAAPDVIVRPIWFEHPDGPRPKLLWPTVDILRRFAWEKMDVP